MATWQQNSAGGLHPVTSAIVGLGSAMFDPQIEYKRRLADQQAAVDAAQIANYNASAGKTQAETLLLNDEFAANAGLGDIIAQAATNGIDANSLAAIASSLHRGGGKIDQLGNVVAQAQLTGPGGNPATDQDAFTALMRQGKMPDTDTAVSPEMANRNSERDALEALTQAVTTTGMTVAGSERNNVRDNASRVYGYDTQADTSRANQGSRNATALEIADGRNDNKIVITGMQQAGANERNNADNSAAIGMNNQDNLTSMTIAAGKPLTLTQVQGELAQSIADRLPKERRDELALKMLEDGGDGTSWQIYQDVNNIPYMVDTKAQAPVPVPLFPDQPPTPGPTTKVGTPGAAPRVPQISSATNDMLSTLISDAFLEYDEVDPSLKSQVTQRAGTLMQVGDPALGILPGNPEGAVSQAIMEMVQPVKQDGFFNQPFGTNVNAVPKQPQGAQAPAPAPQAAPVQPAAPTTIVNPDTGERMQLVNGQWVPVQ